MADHDARAHRTAPDVLWERVKWVVKGCAAVLASPLLIPFAASPAQDLIRRDVRRWTEILGQPVLPLPWNMLILLAGYPEFRNLFYYRLSSGDLLGKVLAQAIKLIYRESDTLSISAQGTIGAGLFIQHGMCTVIAAETIGANCIVRQQVTIGYTVDNECPTLGSFVSVGAGAKILGRVHVGDHVVVGANAVVLKSVPDNCVVVGVPARIVRRNGVRVDEELF